MAFMNQERKKKISPKVKAILNTYGIKGSLAVRNHSTLVLNIRSGCLDFIGNFNRRAQAAGPNQWGDTYLASTYIDVNPYHYEKHFTGTCLKFLEEIMTVMNDGNWDRSDIQTDYFDVGWYVDVNIGSWNKPYALEV